MNFHAAAISILIEAALNRRSGSLYLARRCLSEARACNRLARVQRSVQGR